MDWGGIIAGSMAGGARAVGEMADDTMKRRDQEAAQQRAELAAVRGEERRAALQRENAAYEMDLKLKREDEQGKRYMAQTDKIGDRASQMGLERDDRTMTAARDKLPQSGEFAGQDITTAEIAALPPAARQAYEQAGMIERASGSQQLRDQITAAREIGADKPVRDDLKTSYTAQVASEALTRKELRDEGKDKLAVEKAAEDKRNNIAMENLRAKQIEAMFAKISNGSGGSSKSDTKEWLSIIGQQRLSYSTELAHLRSSKKVALEKVFDPQERASIAESYDDQIKLLGPKMQSIDDKISAVESRLLDKPGAPTMPTRPAPAAKDAPKEAPKPTMPALPQGAKAIGTSGGRTVYQTPDGKKYIGN